MIGGSFLSLLGASAATAGAGLRLGAPFAQVKLPTSVSTRGVEGSVHSLCSSTVVALQGIDEASRWNLSRALQRKRWSHRELVNQFVPNFTITATGVS